MTIAPQFSVPFPVSTSLPAVQFLIGVDGGGTGTRVCFADRKGQLLGRGEAGPSALGQGPQQAWRHIRQALQQAISQAGIAQAAPSECAVGLGLSGAGLAANVAQFMALDPGFALLKLDNDGYTTVLGAHGGRPGGVIASGTGSVAEAVRRNGSRVLVGGCGWITGDEGSGAWLGLKAMRHAEQALDGRAVAGPLARAVWAHAGRDRAALLDWCAAAGQHEFASLAPLVFAQEDADPVARYFVEDAVAELERMAVALDPAKELPMALCGSIAVRLKDRFSPELRARCVEPQGDSSTGALLMIAQALAESP